MMIEPARCINVGIADMRVSSEPAHILRTVLGSCVGICLYDKENQVGGLAHIMLPVMKAKGPVARYADTAIPALIREMVKWGAASENLIAKITGGATMFNLTSKSSISSIGLDNAAKVKEVLAAHKIKLSGEDIGGNFSRTINFFMESGDVVVRSFGRADIVL